MNFVAERADGCPRSSRALEQLRGGGRRAGGAILGMVAEASLALSQVLAKQQPGVKLEEPDVELLPLHLDGAPDVPRSGQQRTSANTSGRHFSEGEWDFGNSPLKRQKRGNGLKIRWP